MPTSAPGQPHSGEAGSLLLAHLAWQAGGRGRGWGGLMKCGVRSPAALFARLPLSGTSGFAQHEAAL